MTGGTHTSSGSGGSAGTTGGGLFTMMIGWISRTTVVLAGHQ